MLSQKELSLLQDLRQQEQLCVEKYTKYAAAASDGPLQTLFREIGQMEFQHLQTLNQLAGVAGQPIPELPHCPEGNRDNDRYLCTDALAGEKHVSAEYDTCIFEFADPQIRSTLNHIQKEEQQHGQRIYSYMAQNGMYN